MPEPPSLRALRVLIAVLTTAVIIVGVYIILQGGPRGLAQVSAAEPIADEPPVSTVAPTAPSNTTATTSRLTMTTTSLPETSPEPPPHGERSVIPLTEVAPEVKQLAVDVAYSLTTYEESDDHPGRFEALGSRSGAALLAEASAPLTHDGLWSRGEVVYPQLGGLNAERASVMVVTRQTVGSGPEAAFSVVRTLDIRLIRGESGWEFDFLSSAGGTFDSEEDLTVAHAVASDPRITMPDSARLDILSGLVSPKLINVMAELADQTPYEVVTLATGHPHNVFDTNRVSHHTIGRAVDINRIGDRLVIDDRETDSLTHSIVGWLYDHPEVHQVGSPWDIDGKESSRSFTNEVHQDHIHLAVND
jgi:hypothetical protein